MNDKIIKYYRDSPFIEKNKITKAQFDLLNSGYRLIVDTNFFNGEIIEKIYKGEVIFVTFLSDHNNHNLIERLINQKYVDTNYEIECKITSESSIVYKKNVTKEQIIIIRKYNNLHTIISETLFVDGELMQHDEILYDINNKLIETRTFIGKNAWAIEKNRYD